MLYLKKMESFILRATGGAGRLCIFVPVPGHWSQRAMGALDRGRSLLATPK